MGIETTDNIDNVIIPQRFIPFDIGTKITERYLVEIFSYRKCRLLIGSDLMQIIGTAVHVVMSKQKHILEVKHPRHNFAI